MKRRRCERDENGPDPIKEFMQQREKIRPILKIVFNYEILTLFFI